MSDQNPYSNENPQYPQTPPTQYAAGEYIPPTVYAQPPVNPYGQPPVNPYGQPPVNPYGQQQVDPYAQQQPANPYGQQQVYGAPPQYYAVPPREPGRGQALAGMILGIISLVICWIPLLGIPVSIVGLILALLGRRSVSRKGMALAGIILSAIGLILTIIVFILSAYFTYQRLKQQ